MDKKTVSRIKIPRGTTIKFWDHPVKLKYALYAREEDGEFVLDDHDLMEADHENNE